jgi:tetratricopeptide (TPR) repeat protein
MYCVYRFIRFQALAEGYRRRWQMMMDQIADQSAQAWGLMVIGIFSIGFDPWPEAEALLQESISLFDQLGDKRNQGDALTALGLVYYFRADFETGVNTFIDLCALSAASENMEHQAFGLNGQAMNLLRLGETEKAIDLLTMAAPYFEALSESRVGEALNLGVYAAACLRQGKLDEARDVAGKLVRLIGQEAAASIGLFDAYAGLAEVYLSLWEQALNQGDKGNLKQVKSSARGARNALIKFAVQYPVGQPRAWLYQGWFAWLTGQKWLAHRYWRKSLAEGKKFDMPYEVATTHYMIGRHLPLTDPARVEHLSAAEKLFSKLGATYNCALSQTALEQSHSNQHLNQRG